MGMTPDQQEVYDLHQSGVSLREISRRHNRNYSATQRLYERAKKWAALDPYIAGGLEQYGVKDLAGVSGGWLIKGDGEGGRLSLRFETAKEKEDWIGKIAAAFENIPAAPPIIQSENTAQGKIGFFPQTDVHLGVDITAEEGGRDYTPEIAVERMKDGLSQTMAAIPPCETSIILDNGDLTHADNDQDETPRNRHRLKVKGPHYLNLDLSVNAKIWQVEMALQRSERVIYRSNGGNHDPSTPSVMHIGMKQRFRDNPRVTIDDGLRETWVYQRGKVFLAAHHGHGIKPQKLVAELPPNFPEEYGRSRFWYSFFGHTHDPVYYVVSGIHVYGLPSICPLDQYAADMGYSDSSAMRAMMFCENNGLKHDMTVRF